MIYIKSYLFCCKPLVEASQCYELRQTVNEHSLYQERQAKKQNRLHQKKAYSFFLALNASFQCTAYYSLNNFVNKTMKFKEH